MSMCAYVYLLFFFLFSFQKCICMRFVYVLSKCKYSVLWHTFSIKTNNNRLFLFVTFIFCIHTIPFFSRSFISQMHIIHNDLWQLVRLLFLGCNSTTVYYEYIRSMWAHRKRMQKPWSMCRKRRKNNLRLFCLLFVYCSFFVLLYFYDFVPTIFCWQFITCILTKKMHRRLVMLHFTHTTLFLFPTPNSSLITVNFLKCFSLLWITLMFCFRRDYCFFNTFTFIRCNYESINFELPVKRRKNISITKLEKNPPQNRSFYEKLVIGLNDVYISWIYFFRFSFIGQNKHLSTKILSNPLKLFTQIISVESMILNCKHWLPRFYSIQYSPKISVLRIFAYATIDSIYWNREYVNKLWFSNSQFTHWHHSNNQPKKEQTVFNVGVRFK